MKLSKIGAVVSRLGRQQTEYQDIVTRRLDAADDTLGKPPLFISMVADRMARRAVTVRYPATIRGGGWFVFEPNDDDADSLAGVWRDPMDHQEEAECDAARRMRRERLQELRQLVEAPERHPRCPTGTGTSYAYATPQEYKIGTQPTELFSEG